MGLGRLRGLLVMTIMRPSEGKAKSETGKAKATVTEKTHPCKNQTRKDGAPDPKRKAKSRSLTPLAKGASGFPSRIGTSGTTAPFCGSGFPSRFGIGGMTVLVLREVEQNSGQDAAFGLGAPACGRQA